MHSLVSHSQWLGCVLILMVSAFDWFAAATAVAQTAAVNAAGEPQGTKQAASGKEGGGRVPWKLLFSGPADVVDSVGKLHYGVTPVELMRECEPAPFVIVGVVPQPDGSSVVYARDQVRPGDSSLRVVETKGDEAYDQITQWKLLRAITRDGVTFENIESLFEVEPAAWTNHFSLAVNSETGLHLLINLNCDRSGFAYTAFTSQDGRNWRREPTSLFYDGDAFSLFYSPALKRFVCVSKSLQPWRKRWVDHGGPTPALGDDAYRDRRVLMFRTSEDGLRWEPRVSLSDVWNRHGKKGAIPEAYLTMPDADDPPDLEFYSGHGFWYHDRAYLMVLNYAASMLTPRKHAPQLDNEWWVSRDGLRWDRPARGVNALGVFPRLNRLEVPPLVADGWVRFRMGHMLMGVQKDRLSFVGARANGEFATHYFKMPEGGLRLNAAIPSPDRPFATNQAYVMVSVENERGELVSGFEREKCVIQNQNRSDIALDWVGAPQASLVGKRVRLRFVLRSSQIYALTP